MQLVGRPKLAKPLPKSLPPPRSKHCWRLSRRIGDRNAKPIGLNEISRIYLPRSCTDELGQASAIRKEPTVHEGELRRGGLRDGNYSIRGDPGYPGDGVGHFGDTTFGF